MLINREIIANSYLHGSGVEIGALHNPLRVPNNAQVKYIDRMDKKELYEQYPELIDLPLVDIDIIDDGEHLKVIGTNQLDFIIANHFLEHCENPILTLINFHRALKNSGIVYLAIPNKDLTFDKNRNRTTLEHLIKDFEIGPVLSRFEHYIEWAKFVDPIFGRSFSPKEEKERAQSLMDQRYSIHFHVWVSEDIIDLMSYINKKMNINLKIIFLSEINDEMIFILQKK